MKILILASWYQNSENIIRGSFFREQAIALKKAGHEVVIGTVETIQTDLKNRENIGMTTKYLDEGIPTYCFTQFSFGCYKQYRIAKGLTVDYYLQRCSFGYRKLFQELRRDFGVFDIVHAHSVFPAGYAAVKYKSILSAPVIITEHLSDIPKGTLSFSRLKGLKKTVNESDMFICVSEYLKESVEKQTGTKKEIRVLPNILSPLFYYDKDIEKNEKFTFVSIGSLIPRKNMIGLIWSFMRAFGDDNSVQLLIIGDGEQRKEIEQLLADQSQSNIYLVGRLDRDSVASTLRRSHAFVLFSNLETFGVVYAEALACGLPTICTYNGGGDEFITKYHAIGISPENNDDLINALIRVRNGTISFDPELSSRAVIDSCSESVIVDTLTSYYKEIVDRK